MDRKGPMRSKPTHREGDGRPPYRVATPTAVRTRAQARGDDEGTLAGLYRLAGAPTKWVIPAEVDVDERARAEVLVAASFVLGGTSLVLSGLIPFSDASPRLLWIFLPALPWHLAVGPLLYRRFRNLTLSASLQSAYLLWCFVFMLLHEGAIDMVSSPWLLVIPFYAMYVGGRTVGLAFTILALLVAFGGYLVQTHGLTLGPPVLPSIGSPLFVFGNNLSLLMIGAIGYLYERNRAQALARIQRTIRRLERSEASLVMVFDSMADGICWVDDDLSITMLNARFQDLVAARTGRIPEPGRSLLEALPDEQHATWVTRSARALAGVVVEANDVIGEGEGRRWQEVTLTPLSDVEGRRGFTIYLRDVTDRLEADDRLRQANRRLVDLSRRAGLAEQATGLLHDLRNALTSVLLRAVVVQEGVDDLKVDRVIRASVQLGADGGSPRMVEYLGALGRDLEEHRSRLRAEVVRLAETLEHVTDLLQAQQAGARAPHAVAPISLERVVESALAMQAPALAAAGVEVIWEDGGVGVVPLDRTRFTQILSNLLANAIDALVEVTGRPRRLWVRTTLVSSTTARVEVRDNGIGIAPEHLPRLFDQGFTTKTAGHGFGLAGATRAARELGATLTASSEGPDQGALFELILPIERTSQQATETQP